LLVSVPISYSLIQHLFFDDVKETLKLQRNEFLHDHLPNLKEADIKNWNRFNRDEKIIPIAIGKHTHKLKKDKIKQTFFYDTLADEHEPYLTLQSPIEIEGKPYVYFSKINLIERDDIIESLALLFIGLILVMLVGLFFITKILSVNLWKPFYVGLDHLEKFEIDKSAITNLSETNINEFIRLNQSIENLIKKNKVIYNDQKEFIEDAAHELQTPLAVIQGKLEAFVQQSNLTQSQAEVLEKLNDAVARLSRLNKNLLLISRIEHEQTLDSENISLSSLIEKLYVFFTEQAASKKIQITVDINPEVTAKVNPILTEVLFSNLFLNAIRHNVIDGKIVIHLTTNSFSIANTGNNVPLPNEKIFERFSKINPSSQGTGLGLAIVKKIAELNRWKIRYHYNQKLHTFTIIF